MDYHIEHTSMGVPEVEDCVVCKGEPCYVCGHGPHAEGSHKYWATSEAAAEFKAEDAKHDGGHNVEAAYVAEHRPY